MLRSIAVLVMFVLAGGPELSVMCKSWCAERDLAAATCHHRDGQTARLTHNATCAERSLEGGSSSKTN